jgi:hypothetical protein
VLSLLDIMFHTGYHAVRCVGVYLAVAQSSSNAELTFQGPLQCDPHSCGRRSGGGGSPIRVRGTKTFIPSL